MNAETDATLPPVPLSVRKQSADLEESLIDGLADHLPGLEIVDRALVLPAGEPGGAALRADLVAVDALGRLVLIALVDGRAQDGRSDETVVAVLESLTILRASRAAIAEHLRSPRLSVDAPALLVLVAEAFSARSVRSLSAVSGRELRLFELRELASARGARTSFAPVHLNGRTARGDRSTQRADFLESLPSELRPTAEVCFARVDRIDTDLEPRSGFDVVSWRYRERRLCSLAWTGELLLGLVASRAEPIPLHGIGDVDPFVDRVIGEHLRGLAREPDRRTFGLPGDKPGEESGVLAASAGVFLSPEEIAAFRD